MATWRSKCGLMELRLGDYRDVLADVTDIQSVITDPPYSRRTHEGDAAKQEDPERMANNRRRGTMNYYHWGDSNVFEFVFGFSSRVDWWICSFSDHHLIPTYEKYAETSALYSFAPIACVTPGSGIRLAGDGPSNWTVYLNVARRRKAGWGTLPGAYIDKINPDRGLHYGGKSISLMRQIVRDYSRKGALVVDPCAGAGSTLIACAIEGRRCIGAEIDPETYEKAVKRLEKGYTPSMF